jgi:hypothetical protein
MAELTLVDIIHNMGFELIDHSQPDGRIMTKIGDGNFSNVYASDVYAFKVMLLPIEWGNTFDAEVDIALAASKLGIGPEYVRSQVYECRCLQAFNVVQIGIIQSVRYAMTLSCYMQNHCLHIDAIKAIVDLIDRWHKAGFVHADLHADNIVVNCHEASAAVTKVRIIDFGASFSVQDVPLERLKELLDHNNATLKCKITALTRSEYVEAIKFTDRQWLTRF